MEPNPDKRLSLTLLLLALVVAAPAAVAAPVEDAQGTAEDLSSCIWIAPGHIPPVWVDPEACLPPN